MAEVCFELTDKIASAGSAASRSTRSNRTTISNLPESRRVERCIGLAQVVGTANAV